jgi:hypothetical protein
MNQKRKIILYLKIIHLCIFILISQINNSMFFQSSENNINKGIKIPLNQQAQFDSSMNIENYDVNRDENTLIVASIIMEFINKNNENKQNEPSESKDNFNYNGKTYCGFALIAWVSDYSSWANFWGVKDLPYNNLGPVADGLESQGFYTYRISESSFLKNTFLLYFMACLILSHNYNTPFLLAVSTHGDTTVGGVGCFVDYNGMWIWTTDILDIFNIVNLSMLSLILNPFGIVAAFVNAAELIVLAGWCESFGEGTNTLSGWPTTFMNKADNGIMAGGWNKAYVGTINDWWYYFNPANQNKNLKDSWINAWYYDGSNSPRFHHWGNLDEQTYYCPHI